MIIPGIILHFTLLVRQLSVHRFLPDRYRAKFLGRRPYPGPDTQA
jgi:hypothetical protein